MLNWLKKLFGAISAYFKSGQAAKDAALALKYARLAAPYIQIVGDIATKYIIHTPGEVDDAVWARIKERLPILFDGKAHTDDEVKGAMIRAAGLLLQSKYPELDLSIAIAAAQNGYLDVRAINSVGQ